MHIRDVKRKIKTVLQINDRGSSSERSNSQKGPSTPMTPTIIVQKPIDELSSKTNRVDTDTGVFFKNQPTIDSKPLSDSSMSEKNKAYVGHRYTQNCENSVEIIENAINKYFQVVTMNNSYDLSKIIEVNKHFMKI